ncbi:hypothetical protein KC338_g270 [Hortaea werneckii]|nr:hypothetical protein KC338_g270 [Hortaea werneckii]
MALPARAVPPMLSLRSLSALSFNTLASSAARCARTCFFHMPDAAVASSSKMIRGSLIIVRAIATRCFSPPERRKPLSPTLVS